MDKPVRDLSVDQASSYVTYRLALRWESQIENVNIENIGATLLVWY